MNTITTEKDESIMNEDEMMVADAVMEEKNVALMSESLVAANLFELHSYHTQVTYAATSILGQPQLSYRDPNFNRNFIGVEISTRDNTELGQQLTVTLEHIPDLRIVTFTLILPQVLVMPLSMGTHIEVPGIITTNHTTIAGPGPGAQRTYSVVRLQGTAQNVAF